jgi:two-component system, sensor histidine kinase and response regulator
VVVDCVKTLSLEASKKDIPILIHADPSFSDPASEYLGDPNRIKQIVMNFLSNAIKFTPSGQIEITVRACPHKVESAVVSPKLKSLQARDEIRIEVKDSGIGIADTSKLFSPFVQAALSTSRMYGGTGLGLSICKQLADIMGGQVRPLPLLLCPHRVRSVSTLCSEKEQLFG